MLFLAGHLFYHPLFSRISKRESRLFSCRFPPAPRKVKR
nr:MAG TPA: hypothetical protein [Caudoviricetes sp.]